MKNKSITFIFPSLSSIFFLVTFLAVLYQGNQMLNIDGDLGHHLAMGRLILEMRYIPQTDPFSFRTEGVLAIPHEWLAQIIFATLDNMFGLTGIVVLSSFLIALTFTLVFRESIYRSNCLLAGFTITFLSLSASSIHWVTRPHLFTYLFLAIWVKLLNSLIRGEEHRWWIFPIIMLIWANMHGMFVLGLLAFVISFFGWVWDRFLERSISHSLGRKLFLAGISSFLATFITPSGTHLWQTIFELAGGSPFITSMTPEYRSANFHLPGTWPFLILLGIILATAVLSGQKFGMSYALQLSGWILVGLYSVRNIPLSSIMLAPMASELLAGWLSSSSALSGVRVFSKKLMLIERKLGNWLWPVGGVGLSIMILATGTSLDKSGKSYQFLPEKFPVAATAWLEDYPQQGRMFNEFDWGGYLLYHLWPSQKIFMDGHTHIYGDQLSREYVAIMARSPGWEESLEGYGVSWAILRSNNPFASSLHEGGWQDIYRDETTVVLRRGD